MILIITLAAASLAGYLAMPALAGLLIVTAWLMSEPGRWSERMRLRRGDRALFFMTMILTVISNLKIAIAVGTGAGLALRLLRKEVDPGEWTPADRSKLSLTWGPFRTVGKAGFAGAISLERCPSPGKWHSQVSVACRNGGYETEVRRLERQECDICGGTPRFE